MLLIFLMETLLVIFESESREYCSISTFIALISFIVPLSLTHTQSKQLNKYSLATKHKLTLHLVWSFQPHNFEVYTLQDLYLRNMPATNHHLG